MPATSESLTGTSASPTVFALSVHAQYVCRHAGACCSAGWTIPVEEPLRLLIGTDLLAAEPDGRCRFHERESRLCSIHRRHGHGSLPLACRMFPRRAVVDRDGVHVTLSHFCPTAAALLFDEGSPLAIVSGPPAFPAATIEDALDARETWPPLVRRHLLFDLDAYRTWERFVVDTLARPVRIDEALSRIAEVGERLREWTPRDGAMDMFLRSRIDAVQSSGAAAGALHRYAAFAGAAAYRLALEATPEDLRPAATRIDDGRGGGRRLDEWSNPVRRYLAAKAFASWTAYQGRGVRTLVAELALTAGILRVEAARAGAAAGGSLVRETLIEAFRAADWLLMHAADRNLLLKALGRIEQAA